MLAFAIYIASRFAFIALRPSRPSLALCLRLHLAGPSQRPASPDAASEPWASSEQERAHPVAVSAVLQSAPGRDCSVICFVGTFEQCSISCSASFSVAIISLLLFMAFFATQ
jgi:hypothetical protein